MRKKFLGPVAQQRIVNPVLVVVKGEKGRFVDHAGLNSVLGVLSLPVLQKPLVLGGEIDVVGGQALGDFLPHSPRFGGQLVGDGLHEFGEFIAGVGVEQQFALPRRLRLDVDLSVPISFERVHALLLIGREDL